MTGREIQQMEDGEMGGKINREKIPKGKHWRRVRTKGSL